jgi:hypothetical protein
MSYSYSPAMVSDLYPNSTNLNNNTNNLLLDSDPLLSVNSSEQSILSYNVSNHILNIKNDLLNELLDTNSSNINLNPDITKFVTNASLLLEKYKLEQKNMIKYEKLYNIEINNTNNSIKSLISYGDITSKLEIEYINCSESKENINIILNNINDIVDKIKNNDKLLDIKNKYLNSRKNMLSYFELVKYLNKDNIGSTCSLCFSNKVDYFMNPCGHTFCGNCKNTLELKNFDSCVFCRRQIISINSLFYI